MSDCFCCCMSPKAPTLGDGRFADEKQPPYALQFFKTIESALIDCFFKINHTDPIDFYYRNKFLKVLLL